MQVKIHMHVTKMKILLLPLGVKCTFLSNKCFVFSSVVQLYLPPWIVRKTRSANTMVDISSATDCKLNYLRDTIYIWRIWLVSRLSAQPSSLKDCDEVCSADPLSLFAPSFQWTLFFFFSPSITTTEKKMRAQNKNHCCYCTCCSSRLLARKYLDSVPG